MPPFSCQEEKKRADLRHAGPVQKIDVFTIIDAVDSQVLQLFPGVFAAHRQKAAKKWHRRTEQPGMARSILYFATSVLTEQAKSADDSDGGHFS
jgi:hypothetical protein